MFTKDSYSGVGNTGAANLIFSGSHISCACMYSMELGFVYGLHV